MIKLKHILTEKRELGGAIIDKIHDLTDRNNHNEARRVLAKAMGNKKLEKVYTAIGESVVKKLYWVIGVAVVSGLVWMAGGQIPKG